MSRVDDTALDRFVRALPKAEMHLHFEGAVRWRTIREVHPWGPSLPATPPWLARPRPFPDFDHFRQVFRDYVLPTTGTPELIERHAFEVVEDLARQNVRYAELIVSHDFHTRRGLSHAEAWGAIAAGRDRAAAASPIDVRLILGINRHRPVDECVGVFDAVLESVRPNGWLAGIDVQGDERVGSHGDLAEIYRRAAEAGLKVRAHAGEHAGAGSVRAAVFDHGVRQVSHGVRAVEDAALPRELARAGVYLHVCPTSNVLLECAPGYRAHQLRTLLDAGVRCTINDDDPLVFGSDVVAEYRRLIADMAFSAAEAAECARNGFRSSLMPPAQVEAMCDEIDRVLKENDPWR
jgi:adenosine deaminase